MDRVCKFSNEHIVALRKVLGIYEETKDMTENQVIQSMHEKIISLSPKESIEIESNEELRKHAYGININILEVILKEIEKLEPEQYTTLNEIKNIAIDIVKDSKINEHIHYVGISNEDKETICENEKQELIIYMHSIIEDDLRDVPQLFHRRVLTEKKVSEVFSKLQNSWLNKCQYALSTDEILCIDSNYFINTVDLDKLIKLLIDHSNESIYEINYCDLDAASYIMDTNALILNNKSQAYWCSDKMDWAIIKDHEGFFFICGKYLAEACNSGYI